jgi:SEC-C motif domain protein
MRSRYTAFTQANLDYLETSLAPEAREDYDRAETETWVKGSEWRGLEVRASSGGPDDESGTVEFVARYKFRNQILAHHELASFRKHEGRWVYVDEPAPGHPDHGKGRPQRSVPVRVGAEVQEVLRRVM